MRPVASPALTRAYSVFLKLYPSKHSSPSPKVHIYILNKKCISVQTLPSLLSFKSPLQNTVSSSKTNKQRKVCPSISLETDVKLCPLPSAWRVWGLRLPLASGAQGRSTVLFFGVCGFAESQGRAVFLVGQTEVVASLALTVNTFLREKKAESATNESVVPLREGQVTGSLGPDGRGGFALVPALPPAPPLRP